MILRSNLPHEYPRRYLAASFDAGDPTSVMKQFDEPSRTPTPWNVGWKTGSN
jgi:hypothetical protein